MGWYMKILRMHILPKHSKHHYYNALFLHQQLMRLCYFPTVLQQYDPEWQ